MTGGARHRTTLASGPLTRPLAGLLAGLLAGVLVGAPAASAQTAIPVLCYHGFDEPSGPSMGRLTESFDRFEAMLRFLAEHGFQTVFPDEVAAGTVPERSVIITFDDGRPEQVRAAEMLERYGFRGIFFVIPARLEEEHPHHLSGADVARLARAGHRVAPHGHGHRSMVASGREVAASLTRSPATLLERAGPDHPISDFAFPFGHYGDEIAHALAGRYPFLHTVNPGYWDGQSSLIPRMLVARDAPLEFYTDYLMAAPEYRPVARLLSADGGAGGTAVFRVDGADIPGDARLLVISDDRDGRMYAAHPVGDHMRRDGDHLVIDIRAHIQRYYPADREVISFALITRGPAGTRYLSPGYQRWIR
jgi:peptidoglycan/xylan/chitin deacetylase (PgdA/CDA1 family)